VNALTTVLFDGAPPKRVLYSTVMEAHARRDLRVAMETLGGQRQPGADTALPASAVDAIRTADRMEARLARHLPLGRAVDVELFGVEPPAEVSVKALLAATRYWQGLSRAAFEDAVPEGAPLTGAGRRAAKALARSSWRLAMLAVMVGIEPHEVAPLFSQFARHWQRLSWVTELRW